MGGFFSLHYGPFTCAEDGIEFVYGTLPTNEMKALHPARSRSSCFYTTLSKVKIREYNGLLRTVRRIGKVR
jgi:hypothetical protein